MIKREYTIKEIDALRGACELRWFYGTTNLTGSVVSGSYQEGEKVKCVEEFVRTYMCAGKTAQDIYDEDKNSA